MKNYLITAVGLVFAGAVLAFVKKQKEKTELQKKRQSSDFSQNNSITREREELNQKVDELVKEKTELAINITEKHNQMNERISEMEHSKEESIITENTETAEKLFEALNNQGMKQKQ